MRVRLPRKPFTELVLMIDAPCAQVGQRGPHHAEVAVDVHVEGAQPALVGDVLRLVDAGQTGAERRG